MSANIEIKARVRQFDALQRSAEAISELPCQVIPQEDTFFNVPQGRLKLRKFSPDSGVLVYYQRQDTSGPKRSDYFIVETQHPEALKSMLAMALGVRGVVRKTRWLYQVGNTRIHLDDVENLGHFLELEVVLQPGQSDEQGQAIALDLMNRLGIQEGDLVDVAYMDLLEDSSGQIKP